MTIARYHDGQRRMQDAFDSRRIADRLDQVTYSRELAEAQRAFVERSEMFFLATVGPDGQPDCSFKGGRPGFVRALSPREIVWPDYDGNGQFRSLGNLLVNPRAGLLFVDWSHPSRLRVNGVASISNQDPLLASWPGAQQVVRLAVEQVFPNCPRYIPRMQVVEPSPYAPAPNHEPPRPGWKDDPRFRDALPARDRPR
ncbi:MAG TPA: pyridoxamine 5'-phosphate oxidase family protein [Candidatus Eisenbacteria bacterium]|jgi:predicted pyridoxine 5'-phosphate oxidase superfamily flavin-nucleotide-binding protein